MRRPRFSPVMLTALLCLLLTHASNRAFGVEILHVTCGPANPNGHLGSRVTVNVSMTSGPPDYVDITYSAVDSNGVSLTCNPASDVHEPVSRTHPFTDYIQVTATTTTAFPVQFTAYATGESAGGDNASGSMSLNLSNFGSFASPKTATAALAQVTPVATSTCQIVPISIIATTSNKLETLTRGYTPNYSNNSLKSSLLTHNAVSVMAPLVALRKAFIEINSVVPRMGQLGLMECRKSVAHTVGADQNQRRTTNAQSPSVPCCPGWCDAP
jgi:hypothetical protein